MASTLLVKDVLLRVAVLLNDNAPQFQRWTENELVNWLGDAQVAITKFLPAMCSRIDTVRLQVGTRQSIESVLAADCKPGDGSTPTVPIQGTQFLEVFRNMGTDGVTPGKSIRITERKILDSQTPNWHTVTGAAVASLMYDPRFPKYFYVTPGLSARAWIELGYTAQPLAIPNTGTPGSELYLAGGGSTQKLSVSDENVDDLVNYVVARANMKDVEWADANKAQAFGGSFLNSINARVAALTGMNPNLKSLPFAPEPLARASK